VVARLVVLGAPATAVEAGEAAAPGTNAAVDRAAAEAVLRHRLADRALRGTRAAVLLDRGVGNRRRHEQRDHDRHDPDVHPTQGDAHDMPNRPDRA
jgi:hypothetical protein